MANGERNPLITLVEVAFSAKDAKDKYGMKIGDHKLICSVLDSHLKVTKEDTDKQNKAFKIDLIGDVREVMVQELRPINATLLYIQDEVGNIRQDMVFLKSDIKGLHKKVENMEVENARVHDDLKAAIDEVKEQVNHLKPKLTSKALIIRGIIIGLCTIATLLGLLAWIAPWFHGRYLK